MTRPTPIDLSTDEYNQGLYYYLLSMVNLDRCNRCCNTLDDPWYQIECVSNKMEDENLSAFNMITRTIESKTLKDIYHANVNTSLIMIENVTQIRRGITINANVKANIWKKKHYVCKKYIYLKSCTLENGKYSGSIIGDSVMKWNYKSEKKYSNEKNGNKNVLYFTHRFNNYHNIYSC